MFKKISDSFCTISVSVADKASSAPAIILFPVLCGLWVALTGLIDELTLILSVLAITLTQMVLQGQKKDTEIGKLQMAELIHAIPGARDEFAKLEGADPDVLRHLQGGEEHGNRR